ncbi:hypothetical protein ACQKMD_11180 [Viridibacillus sp. NPDC096237]|uniref:hypothetical protein n=1 Tax=Viridibacillus sp. NPDC096237 TaxID=3390721 RepID=UPI003D0547BD
MSEIRVTFNQHVKLDKDLFQKGNTVNITEDVFNSIKDLDIIDPGYEHIVEVQEAPKSINEMTVPELKQFADDNKIDLGEAKKRDEIIEIIQVSIEKGSE